MSLFVHSENSTSPELETMVGKPLEEVTKVAQELGFVVRLVEVDGEPYSLESAFNDRRVNLKVVKGIVVEVGVG